MVLFLVKKLFLRKLLRLKTAVSSQFKYLLTIVSLFTAACLLRPAYAQSPHYNISGVVRDAASGEPLAGAVVNIDELWAVTEADGSFTVERVSSGKCTLKTSLLGYVDVSMPLEVKADIKNLEIKMQVSTLALKEVVVGAAPP